MAARSRALCVSAVCVLCALSLACGDAGDVQRITLGHGLDPGHPVHVAMLEMGRLLEARSAGALVLDVHPSEQLGSERECLELLQIGSLGMTKVSAAVMESFAPSYRVLSTPYLFRDEAHRTGVLDGAVGESLLRSSLPQRLLGLAFYDAGSRSFYTRDRPVRTPDDLLGLKIRTQESPSALALVRALGAAAAPIAWGELYTALQQGVVDGAENNPPSFHLAGHYEVARFYSLDEHTSVPDVLLVSTAVWDRLDAAERAWLRGAARDSVVLQRRLWQEASDAALAAVRADGVEVIRPDQRAFVEATALLREQIRADPDAGPLLRRIEDFGS